MSNPYAGKTAEFYELHQTKVKGKNVRPRLYFDNTNGALIDNYWQRDDYRR